MSTVNRVCILELSLTSLTTSAPFDGLEGDVEREALVGVAVHGVPDVEDRHDVVLAADGTP